MGKRPEIRELIFMGSWRPVPGNIVTRWTKDVTPENVWSEYPRPQMRRPEWVNLNGLWKYGIVSRKQDYSLDFDNEILVPYPIESALSGVKRALQPDERLWYQRNFTIPDSWHGNRVLLHFGAVDWEASIWVNGTEVGTHRGGYLPFWFDITPHLLSGENELIVSVWDPTDASWQQHGKQVRKPKSIWYTAVSGIWQTVWLEPVPETAISGLKITPDVDAGTVRVKVDIRHSSATKADRGKVSVTVHEAGVILARVETDLKQDEIEIPISNMKLWSPDTPHLYDLVVEVGEDRVESYFGMRKFSLGKDSQGRTRLCLNNQPFFQFGPLDQGYWPDGLYTPPTDNAMRWDLEMIKSLGFNMLRKHVKVEPARFYYACDKLGLIVWQDMVNGGAAVGDVTSFLAILFGSRKRDRNYRFAGRSETASRQDFRRELQELVDHLYGFTCIGMWVPFNEGWGQFDANSAAEWLRNYDPTRLVDHASGWFDQGSGDCKSLHVYFKKLPVVEPEKKRASVLSEFGGYSMKVDGHLWNAKVEFGYKKFSSKQALTESYLELLEKELKPCIEAGLSAAIYTQTTDVEIEVNGYITYDREIEKMDFRRVQRAHRNLSEE
jgi:beta-galactosidase/beta-glucuronidase